MSKDLARALRQRTVADDRVFSVLRRDYPKGRAVAWMHGGVRCVGTIVDTSMDRAKVTNFYTGRTYWVYAYDIVSAISKGRSA